MSKNKEKIIFILFTTCIVAALITFPLQTAAIFIDACKGWANGFLALAIISLLGAKALTIEN